MEKIIHRFSLDVNKNGVQRTIQGIETGERYARELRITLRNGKENYEIPSDDSVKAVMYIRKPSSEIVSVNDCTIEGDEIVYLLGAEDVSVAGTIIMQLKVIGSLRGGAEAVLVSPRFNLEVWESETDDSGAESTDTFTALENALAQAQIAYSGRVTHVEIDEDYLITVTFNNGQTYESDALQQMSDKIKEIDESVETLDTKIDGKADKVDPTTSGIFTHNGDAKMEDIDAHIIKATSLRYMESDGYHIVANEIKTLNDKDASLRNELTFVESSVSKTTQKLKEEIESASERAEDAYNLASRANREAASAINLANDNKAKIDLHTGLIGEGVGDKEVPVLGYLDGYYIAPNGRVTQYNATATVISIDFLDFFFNGDNIIFNHVDLLPTENCIPCAWFDISGNFISATDGLNIIAEIDEQTFKITKQYIDYCVIPVPAGAHSCKMSGLANGIADIRIQTSLSEAIKDLQSKPETVPLVLTNPSPLPATDSKSILGIHAKGKSEQYVSPNLANFMGNGIINGSGGVSASNSAVYSDFIAVNSGAYTFSCNASMATLCIATYDANKTFITRLIKTNAQSYTATLDSNVKFVRVYFAMSSDMAYATAITTYKPMFNSGASALPYEPYTGTPTPTSPIPIVDASEVVTAIEAKKLDSGFEQGGIGHTTNANYSANKVSSNTRIRIAELMPTVSGQIYTFTCNSAYKVIVQSFNESGLLVDTNGSNAWNNPLTVTASASMGIAVCKADNSNITPLDISNANVIMKGGQSNSITLPYTLKSVGNVADELVVNEDGSAKIVQRVEKVVINGSENWTKGANGFYSKFNDVVKLLDYRGYLLSDRFVVATNNNTLTDGQISAFADNNSSYPNENWIYIRYDACANANELKTWLASNNVTVYFARKTPIETPLTPEEVASIRQLQTYKGTTVIESEMQIDSVTYSGDVKAYIDGFHTYSTVPTICGYEEDGTPIYKVKIYGTTPSAVNTEKVITNLITKNNAKVKNIGGMIETESFQITPNMYYSSTYNIATFVTADGIVMRTPTASYTNMPCEIIVEYILKDASGIALLSNEGEVVADE